MKLMEKELPVHFRKVDDSVLVRNRIGSTEKIRRELGFRPETVLEKGIQETIDWKTALRNS